MIPVPATTAEAARAYARHLSTENPGKYVTLFTCFGIFATVADRLHVFAPTDSWGDSYWLNGTEKPFTSAQRLADQMATPTGCQ